MSVLYPAADEIDDGSVNLEGFAGAAAGERPPPEERFNILVVDDRPQNLLVLDATLERLNQNVVKAQSGREALRHLLERDFAVILLDVEMPEMDGFETARMIRARERTRHTPIVFLTAVHKNEAQVAQGYAVGAVDYILKPFVPEVVRAKVAAFVELFRMTRDLRIEVEHRRLAEEQLDASNALLQAISQSLVEFIVNQELAGPCRRLLRSILSLSRSEYGFFAEILDASGSAPRLVPHAAVQLDAESDRREGWDKGPEPVAFADLPSLCSALAEATPDRHLGAFLAAEPATAPARLGLPGESPPLRNLLCLPIHRGHLLTGLIGLGNVPGGYDAALVDSLAAVRSTCACLIEAYHGEQERLQAERNRERQVMLEQEIAIGRTIQMGMLPPTRLRLAGCEILSRSVPAAEVGGDFYNVFSVGRAARSRPRREPITENGARHGRTVAVTGCPDRLGVLLGDVAGKGIPAALFMAMTTTLIQGQARFVHSPGQTLAAANAELYLKLRQRRAARSGLFATAAYGVIDLDRREIRLASAGQTPVIYWPAAGEPRYLRLKGVPLGALPDPTYAEERLRATPGDRLLFYSDGFVESRGADGEPLGYPGFLHQVGQLGDLAGPDLVDALFRVSDARDAFPAERDDRTLVLITIPA